MTPSPPRAGWMLDERAHAGRENLDASHVERYDAIEDADAAAEVAFLRVRGLDAGSTVVEFGAGTGQFTVEVAAACRRVVAVDVSGPMLDLLRTKAAAHSNIEAVEGGFLTYEHDGEPADVVYSRYALHHLPDFWKSLALARMYAVVRPGGLVRIWDVVYHFSAAEAPARLEAWCAAYDGAAEGQWSRADVEEHIRDEHSTYTWLFEAMCRDAGFLVEQADYSTDDLNAQYLLRRPSA